MPGDIRRKPLFMNHFSFRAHPEKFGTLPGKMPRPRAMVRIGGSMVRIWEWNRRRYSTYFLKLLVVFDTFALRAWNPNLKNTTRWTHCSRTTSRFDDASSILTWMEKHGLQFLRKCARCLGERTEIVIILSLRIKGCIILCECASITDAFAAVAGFLFGWWIAVFIFRIFWPYYRKSKSFLLHKSSSVLSSLSQKDMENLCCGWTDSMR